MHAGLHHAEKRKKEGNADTFDHVMIVVGLIGPLSLIPQVFTVWAGKTEGISLLSWVLLVAVSLMWAMYGIARHSKALIVANALATVLNLSVVIGVLMLR